MQEKVLAFVLISTELGCERHVLDDLKKVEDVREAFIVYGIHDIVAEIEGDSQDEIKKAVFTRIRGFPDVKSSLTLVVSHS